MAILQRRVAPGDRRSDEVLTRDPTRRQAVAAGEAFAIMEGMDFVPRRLGGLAANGIVEPAPKAQEVN